MSIDISNQVVLITGASSGIGKAAAYQFAQQGARLILAARRIDRIKKIAEDITTNHQVDVLPIQLDVQDKERVKTVIKELPESWCAIDILVNNAGLALQSEKFHKGDLNSWDTMIATNVNGLLYVTHAVLNGMVARNCGHIINVGSIASHDCYMTGNVYCATKHAVKAISKSLRIDLLGLPIRVSEVDPGAVQTEFSEVRWQDKKRSDDFYSNFEPLVADDIADAMIYCATRPLHVNVAAINVYPTMQARADLIYKEGQEDKSVFE